MSLTMKPAIGDDRDVVILWDELEHRHSEGSAVLILGVSLPKDEGVVEENNLAVHSFDDGPE